MRTFWLLSLLVLIASVLAESTEGTTTTVNETQDECTGNECKKENNDEPLEVVMDASGNVAAASSSSSSSSSCFDRDDQCGVWAAAGECETNVGFMLLTCPKSCGSCKNDFMAESALPVCTGEVSLQKCEMQQEVPLGECKDQDQSCKFWASTGECDKNPNYMLVNCCASCDELKPRKKEVSTTVVVPMEDCVDKHEHCDYWLEQNECEENPHYMSIHCPKICDFCGKTIDLIKKYDDSQHDQYGVMQTIMPDKIEETHTILKQMEKYVDAIREKAADNPAMLRVMKEECTNKHAQCAFWATLGECRKNPTYMKINCGPVCGSCDHIGMMQRCPLDPFAPRAYREPGELNLAFFNLTTHEAFKKYGPKVLSRPSYINGDNKFTADYKVGPWVVTLENFLTQEEADRLIELGRIEGYKRSAENSRTSIDGSYNARVDERRTSTNAWCNTERCLADPVAQDVMARVAEITNTPIINQEYLQMLQYEEGQYYKIHHDYIESQANRQPGVRMVTVFLYLNDVEEGGGTKFSTLDITVMPKRGRVLVWPSVLDEDSGVIDTRTQHEALPVEKGMKYAANAWIHQRDFQGPFKTNCQ